MHEFGNKATIFREDFCSTFLNSLTWVKSNPKNVAYAIDLDPVPLQYGKEVHIKTLREDQKKRLHVVNDNVMTVKTPKVQIISISNFSICFLKKRKDMLAYFKACLSALQPKGLFIFDLLGGEELPEDEEDATNFKLPDGQKATYYWEHASYNVLSNEAEFYIHYKIKGQKKMNRVFSYDWRMWSLPELKDLLLDAGYSRVDFYWEGDEKNGNGGNGIYRKAQKAKSCPIWLAYIVAVK